MINQSSLDKAYISWKRNKALSGTKQRLGQYLINFFKIKESNSNIFYEINDKEAYNKFRLKYVKY